jgi:hypothetical protein
MRSAPVTSVSISKANKPPDPRPVQQWSDQELLEAWMTLKRREEECFEAQRLAIAREDARAARQALWEALALLFVPPLALLGVLLLRWGVRAFKAQPT